MVNVDIFLNVSNVNTDLFAGGGDNPIACALASSVLACVHSILWCY